MASLGVQFCKGCYFSEEASALALDMARYMERYGKLADQRRPSEPFQTNPDDWLCSFRDAFGEENENFTRMTHGLGPIVVKTVINRYVNVLDCKSFRRRFLLKSLSSTQVQGICERRRLQRRKNPVQCLDPPRRVEVR